MNGHASSKEVDRPWADQGLSATQIIEWVIARTLAQRRMGGTSVGPNAGEVLKDAARLSMSAGTSRAAIRSGIDASGKDEPRLTSVLPTAWMAGPPSSPEADTRSFPGSGEVNRRAWLAVPGHRW